MSNIIDITEKLKETKFEEFNINFKKVEVLKGVETWEFDISPDLSDNYEFLAFLEVAVDTLLLAIKQELDNYE